MSLNSLISGRELIRAGKGRSIREAVGLTAADVAREVDVDPSTVRLWERKLRTPSGEPGRQYALLLHHLAFRVAPILGTADTRMAEARAGGEMGPVA